MALAIGSLTIVSCDNTASSPQTTAPTAKAVVDKINDVNLGCGSFCEECGCMCVTGRIHTVENGNGLHVNLTVTAIGVDCETGEPNGLTYVGSDNFNVGANGAMNETLLLNGKGSACKIKIHYTINANGEVTVDSYTCG